MYLKYQVTSHIAEDANMATKSPVTQLKMLTWLTTHIAEDANMAVIKLERERRKHTEAQWLMVK